MIVLVKMNKRTFEIYLEKDVSIKLWEFAKDEQIYYTGSDIVLFVKNYEEENLPRYKKELVKAMSHFILTKIQTANHELKIVNDRILELNEQYLKLVKTLV